MANQQNAPLPEGHEVAGYRIVRRIANGGFSIVYLAQDVSGEQVVIKEYLPGSLARRMSGQLVPEVSEEHLPTYRNGLKCFFEEGRALARVIHPCVVRVLNFFRANETVYMVLAYEEGRSLQELIVTRRKAGGPIVLPERMIRRMFADVMSGLREVHTQRMLHLDLKPANIYIRREGRPILLDFGAARQTLTRNAPRLFPMYTPGFAPPELQKKGAMLGPWSDVYGLGASMYACMSGAPPQAADQRREHDRVADVLRGLERHYSAEILDLVQWCMMIDPLERPQSVFALQRLLRGQMAPDASPVTVTAPATGFRDTLLHRSLSRIFSTMSSGRESEAAETPVSVRHAAPATRHSV